MGREGPPERAGRSGLWHTVWQSAERLVGRRAHYGLHRLVTAKFSYLSNGMCVWDQCSIPPQQQGKASIVIQTACM